MTLPTGARLGPYEILAALGAGGMGEVYRARDTRLDRIVAIKILPEALAADPQFRDRFDREARAISSLDHPHICTLYDVGEQSSATDSGPAVAYLVLQYLEGETLETRLKKGALPLDQALTIAIQISSALDKAHRAGITHRDLKPGNVMLTKTGAKLLDFGLAKSSPVVASSSLSMVPTTPPAAMTAAGTILGTFQYMAPEQIEGEEADARTDLFAFGVVLYEMLTGKHAFTGKTQASLFGAILKDEPPAIATLQPVAPLLLDHIVRGCLAKNPDERCQSAHDLMRDLKWIADGGAAGGQGIASLHAVDRSARSWALLALTTMAAAGLGVAGTLYVRRPAPDPPQARFEIQTPPTDAPSSFALSPDGRHLVFVATFNGASRLWLRSLDDTVARPLAGTDGATVPFWAPDSRALAFMADGKLKRFDLTSGVPQILSTLNPAITSAGTWSRDGMLLIGVGSTSGLMRVPASGGPSVLATRLVAGQAGHSSPKFLPDGRHFLFWIGGTPETRGEYLGSLDGDEPRRILSIDSAASYAAPGHLLFVRQGVLLAQAFDPGAGTLMGEPAPVAQDIDTQRSHAPFSVSTTGTLAYRTGAAAQRRRLLWVDRAGRTLGALRVPDEQSIGSPEIAPDGRRVAVSRISQGNTDVWLIDVERGGLTRFTSDPGSDLGPLWSSDGRRIFFRSNRRATTDVFEKLASGEGDERPLLVTEQNKVPWSVSPEGRALLYGVVGQKTGQDLWALPLTGDRKPFPVAQTTYDEGQGQFSPDSRWIAYTSNESGAFEIYVQPFPGPGRKWQVSSNGGTQPRWRHNGKELFYVSPDGKLMAARIALPSDGQTVTFEAPVSLFPVRLASGSGTGGAGTLGKQQYAVAADGRFLIDAVVDEAPAPITIVQNWTAGLKK